MTVHALIVAAGRGHRFGADLPKQYLKIGKLTVLEHTLSSVSPIDFASQTLVVARDDEHIQPLELNNNIRIVYGGQERYDSVKAGIQSIAQSANLDDLVLIHDVARPCVLAQDVQAVIERAVEHETGAILAVPVADTLKFVHDGQIHHTVNRSHLWQAQTPQVFRLDKLLRLMDFLNNHQDIVTDEALGFELMGLPVAIVQGSSSNMKLTHQADLFLIEAILTAQNRL